MKTTMTFKAAVLLMLTVGVAGCTTTPASKDADAEFASCSDLPPTAETLYASSKLLAARGREDEAFWVLKRITRDFPNYAPAYCDIAEYHMRHNRLSEATAAIKSGLAIAPDEPVLLNNLGMCSMMKGDSEQALAHFTRAASLAPGDAHYRANMGAALGMMGRYDESYAIYEQVLDEENAHYNVGVLAQARGDKARADEEFAAADAVHNKRHEHDQAQVKTPPSAPAPAPEAAPAQPTAPQ
jgi:Flp pilus assembly protein TadD